MDQWFSAIRQYWVKYQLFGEVVLVRILSVRILLSCITLILSGCFLSTQPALPDTMLGETGTVVIRLQRTLPGEENPNWQGHIQEAQSLSAQDVEDWPRTVDDIIPLIEGYRVRIEGSGVDVTTDGFFEEQQEEVTISITVPVGSGYSVKVLALGPPVKWANRLLLLGAGLAEDVAVLKDTVAVVEVPMEPYRYGLETPSDPVQLGAIIPITYTVKGPLLSEISPRWAYLYYSLTNPTEDLFGERLDKGISSLSPTHLEVSFDIPGQTTEGTLHLQFLMYGHSIWEHESKLPTFVIPCMAIGETADIIAIQSGGGSLSVVPTW